MQADSTYDKALTDKVGRTVTLVVNTTADKAGARTVKIKPISAGEWRNLLYEKWLDERRAIVEKVSGGRLGYLHVPDMGDAARNRFERELFSVGQRKEGMIIDLRFNNGGDTHDSLLKILERNRHYFTFAPRTEAPFPQPERAYTKPILLLVNEFALSDAEVFTNGFKEFKLGKVVGTPTMGWIIFTSGTGLLDGSFMRIPFMGCYTLNGRDMENWGVPPDILVEKHSRRLPRRSRHPTGTRSRGAAQRSPTCRRNRGRTSSRTSKGRYRGNSCGGVCVLCLPTDMTAAGRTKFQTASETGKFLNFRISF